MNTTQSKNISKHPTPAKFNFYLLMNISLVFFLPLLSVLFACFFEKESITIGLVAKWFIFWAIGIRLFTAGIKQATDPAFTGKQIFKFSNEESFVVIRELGFGNIALGVISILSVINDQWRILAAIGGGLFFGFAALQHLVRKPAGKNELIALVYDAVVFAGLVAYLFSLI